MTTVSNEQEYRNGQLLDSAVSQTKYDIKNSREIDF